jgi:hypothetical protein
MARVWAGGIIDLQEQGAVGILVDNTLARFGGCLDAGHGAFDGDVAADEVTIDRSGHKFRVTALTAELAKHRPGISGRVVLYQLALAGDQQLMFQAALIIRQGRRGDCHCL